MEHFEPAPTIRRLEREDVDEVVAACSWLFAAPASMPDLWNPAAAAGRLNRLCEADRSTAFVAQLDDKIVGFCTVYLDLESLRFGQRAWLNDMAVDPQHRSRGLGHRLLQAARTWAPRAGRDAAPARLQHGPHRRAPLLPPRTADL